MGSLVTTVGSRHFRDGSRSRAHHVLLVPITMAAMRANWCATSGSRGNGSHSDSTAGGMATRTDRSSSSALRREGIAAESGAIRNIAPTGVVCPCLKAVGWNEFGGPEALHVVGLPDPEAGPRELRIRVHWAAVNPTDTGLRSGGRAAQLKDIAPPHVPGMDAAGVLERTDR